MISTPPPSILAHFDILAGVTSTESENRALSPKRCFSQQEEDQPAQLDLKRRHVRPGPQSSRRAPLYPLSPSDLENRRMRRSQSTSSLSHLAMPTSSGIRLVQSEQRSSSGFREMPSADPVCSWPPPIPAKGNRRSSHSNGFAGQQASQSQPLHRFGEKSSSRAIFSEATQTEPKTLTVNPVGTTEWLFENGPQPIRLHTLSLSACPLPLSTEFWQSEDGSTEVYDPVDPDDLLLYPTPPGLPLPSKLRRTSSDSDPLVQGSLSLSLAAGSQPLAASEPTKIVPPIGAERSRVLSTASLQSSNSPPANHSLRSSLSVSPKLQAKWKTDVPRSSTAAQEKVRADGVSREDLERLLRHAVLNKHAPKILSPLNPLRTASSAFDLSADPAFQVRMPSKSNPPSPRYIKCLPRRTRTLCDAYQSFDWTTTCMHCQECKRDRIGKRLLAMRYRQCRRQSSYVPRQPKPPIVLPCRAGTPSVMDDDRIALASRIREAFAYELDEEEKTLWEEVAAVTGGACPPLARVGTLCATVVAIHQEDEGDHLGIPDDGMRTNASATLFRDVRVY